MRSLGLQTLFPHRHELREPHRSRSTKRSFLEYFKIVSTGRAEMLGRKEQIVCDVIVIDDSDGDDAEMQLLPSPTSPRRLIPGDGRNFKRSSSIERKNAVVVKRGNDTITATSHSAEKLLRIDVSSPLGHRLRDHVDTLNSRQCEPYENQTKLSLSGGSVIINNVNMYCQPSSLSRYMPFIDRLRQPSDYRITFRANRQQCRSSYSHAYKFSRRQRKEFCRAFDCGLSIRSRRMLRRMKPCRVDVFKLSPTTPKTYYYSVSEMEQTSNQIRLVLRTCKSAAVSLTKCDYQMTGGSVLDANRCNLNTSQNSQVISGQMASDLLPSECSTQITAPACPTPNSNEYHFDSEASATFTPASEVTADENIIEMRQQCDENTLASSGCSVSAETNMQNCSDLLTTTTASLNVPTTSVNSVETITQTTDKDCQAPDAVTDCDSSMEQNASSWSMNDDLPALSFFCNICGDVVECEQDSKPLIVDHYAGHGITNIDLMDEVTPSGEKVIKLIERPVAKANTSTATHSLATSLTTTADQPSSSSSISAQPSCLSQTESVSVSNSASALHAQKKRRRVTWADEVCDRPTRTPQQPQHIPSPVSVTAVHQDTTMGSTKQRLTLYASPQASGSVTSALCSSNNQTLPPPVALRSGPSVPGTNLSSTMPVDKRPPCTFPVTTKLDTPSSAIRCPDTTKSASERARLFWSKSSLGEDAIFGGLSSVAERLHASRMPVSTALPIRTQQATSTGTDGSRTSLPLPAYTPPSAGHSMLPDNSRPSVSSRNKSYPPGNHHTMQQNSCRQSYQQGINVICID